MAQGLLHPSKPNKFIKWTRDRLYLEPPPHINLDLASTSPLHFGAALSLPEICQWLLKNGSDASKPSEIGLPLDYALLGTSIFSVSKAIMRSPDSMPSSLSNELQQSQPPVVQAIIDGGANVGKSCLGVSPLHIAASIQDEVSCIELLRHGANPDEASAFELRIGSMTDTLADQILTDIDQHGIRGEVRPFLLDAVLRDPSDSTITPMALTRCFGTSSIGPPGPFFVTAAFQGQFEIVQQVWNCRSFDINTAGEIENCSALHAAASNGHAEIVRFLVDQGADCSLMDGNGLKPTSTSRRAVWIAKSAALIGTAFE